MLVLDRLAKISPNGVHALERFSACQPVRELLGEPFFRAFFAIKEAELEAFQGVISSWERDHLLLKV